MYITFGICFGNVYAKSIIMKNRIFLLSTLLLIIAFSSCKKDQMIEPSPAPAIETMNELKVPSDFNWKTTRDYQFSITTASDGIATISNEDGTVVYQKAFMTANNAYQMKMALPTYETKVRLSFKGQIELIELDNTSLSHQFNL